MLTLCVSAACLPKYILRWGGGGLFYLLMDTACFMASQREEMEKENDRKPNRNQLLGQITPVGTKGDRGTVRKKTP